MRGYWTTLIHRRYRRVLAREPVHNHNTWPRSPVGRGPGAQPVSVGPDSSRTTSMLPAKPSTAVEVALRVPSSPECLSLRARISGLSSCVWCGMTTQDQEPDRQKAPGTLGGGVSSQLLTSRASSAEGQAAFGQRPGGPRQLRRLLRLGYRLNPIPASLGVGDRPSQAEWDSY